MALLNIEGWKPRVHLEKSDCFSFQRYLHLMNEGQKEKNVLFHRQHTHYLVNVMQNECSVLNNLPACD